MGDVNAEISEEHFEGLREEGRRAHRSQRPLRRRRLRRRRSQASDRRPRRHEPSAYHALFARTMFIDPSEDGAARRSSRRRSSCTRPGSRPTPEVDGTRTGTFVVLHPSAQEVLIGGTLLRGRDQEVDLHADERPPAARGRLPDALLGERRGRQGDVAIFFGLSGTGKTTLSADPERTLIGDDEHGWGDDGVFNFEGGCYAKVIRLSAEAEPRDLRDDAHASGRSSRTSSSDERGVLDLDDDSKTENTRAAYKLEQIANALPAKRAGHPSLGDLPHRRRVRDPAADRAADAATRRCTGSSPASPRSSPAPRSASRSRSRPSRRCFGAPFLPQPPVVYARLLAQEARRARRAASGS